MDYAPIANVITRMGFISYASSVILCFYLAMYPSSHRKISGITANKRKYQSSKNLLI